MERFYYFRYIVVRLYYRKASSFNPNPCRAIRLAINSLWYLNIFTEAYFILKADAILLTRKLENQERITTSFDTS